MQKYQSTKEYLIRHVLLVLLIVAGLGTQASSQQAKGAKPKARKASPKAAARAIAPDVKSAIDRISADSMRGHLSFIASDLLEGRNTPSPGLDIAAEYIASQFRRAGLEPGGDADEGGARSYFQVANWSVTQPDAEAFNLTLNDGVQTHSVAMNKISYPVDQAVILKDAPLIRVPFKPAAEMKDNWPENIEGKVVLTEIPDIARVERERRAEFFRVRNDFLAKLRELKAGFIISIDRQSPNGRGLGSGRLIDPARPRAGGPPPAPYLAVHDPRVINFFDGMQDGQSKGSISLNIGQSIQKPVRLKNVIAILRGSDPVLKETCVIVSAHYDHVGVGPTASGDNIFNGANDDGSGTVSVIELASALATLKQRPKRSIVFITWFGEEKGLLGSRFYGARPVFPLNQTVAMVNLEQVGRTDSTEGPQLNNATMTGFDFTDMGPIFKAAGEKTGITVYKHELNSDAFFGRSDNQALADQGVPAHTLCVAFVYPDYHQPGDHWDKVDYENMARVNRMIGLSLVTIANNSNAPKWNTTNPKTARYVKAWEAMQGK
ncbi:MAG: M20/M25/M40 family metallo-hydrolase [Acidobacteria bacterium]|nr:M20/M25/M40 family metallo-hydrolase [Acidobacteriota bacterium]